MRAIVDSRHDQFLKKTSHIRPEMIKVNDARQNHLHMPVFRPDSHIER
jgi:hypothetical protein